MAEAKKVDTQKEAEVISLGDSARNLMEDPAFIHVLKMLEKEYWTQFKKTALTPEARALLQAKAQVLDDVQAGLHVMMDAGTTATIRRDKRERTADR